MDRVDMGLRRLLETAVGLDRSGQSREAARRYLEASRVLLHLSRSATLPSLRRHYMLRAQECVDRVRELCGPGGPTTAHTRHPPTHDAHGPHTVTPADSDEQTEAYPTESDQDVQRVRQMVDATIVVERPDTRMSDVVGLDDVKQTIEEAVIAPMTRPELFAARARRPWRGVLLYGPAGCGKTLVARAVAAEVSATFFNVSAANIVSKWLGESERLVHELFRRARELQPSVIFIDELDALGTARSADDVGGERRLKTQLLTEMQGLREGEDDRVTVIAATNLPWELDFALCSRFEKRIHVPLPDKGARAEIFRVHMTGVDVAPDVDYEYLAGMTEGYSGRDISTVCREAAMEAVREVLRDKGSSEGGAPGLRPVTMGDFLRALTMVSPSTDPRVMQRYIEWAEGS